MGRNIDQGGAYKSGGGGIDAVSGGRTMAGVLPDDTRARCQGCGYSLRALSEGRCPECGREFDPNDPATMDTGTPNSFLDRIRDRYPWWVVNAGAAVSAILTLVTSSKPGGVFQLNAFAKIGWFLFGAMWFVGLCSWMQYRVTGGVPSIRQYWRVLIAPGILLLTVLFLFLMRR